MPILYKSIRMTGWPHSALESTEDDRNKRGLAMSALRLPTTTVRFCFAEPDSVSESVVQKALGVTPQSSSIVRLSAHEAVYCIRDAKFGISLLETLSRLEGVRTITLQRYRGFRLLTLGTLYWLPSNQLQHPSFCSRLSLFCTSLTQMLFCADRDGRIEASLRDDVFPLILNATAGEPRDAA